MTRLAHHPESLTADAPGWIAGDELGVSSRYVRRLYHKLAPLGGAKRDGKLYLFDRSRSQILNLLAKRERRRSLDGLAGMSERQIADARAREKVLLAARREIPQYMARVRAGRTDAVEWFARVRVAELSGDDTPKRERLAFPQGVPNTTFRRWEKRYRADGVKGLADTRGRSRPGHAAGWEDAWNYFKLKFLDANRPKAKSVYRETALVGQQHGWRVPSYRAFCMRIEREIPNATLVLKREGREAWEAKCAPRIRRDLTDISANQVWCGDEHTLDIYCQVRGRNGEPKRTRPVLTAWQDVRSRMFVGWHIAPTGNSDTIVAALKMGIAEHGPPAEVHIDNGADYKAVGGRTQKKKWAYFDQDHQANVYAELDIAATWAIPYAPWSKPIESNFRWVCEEFSKRQRSYCGNTPDNRPEHAMRIPEDKLPTLDEVREAFADALAWIHAIEREASGIWGMSPIEAMRRFRGGVVRAIPEPAMLDYLCARVIKRPVKVTKDGVRYDGLHYGGGARELYRLLGQEVRVKIHPETRDYVDVLTLDGKPVCRARHDVLTGTQPDDIKRAARRRKAALKAAREGAAAVPVIRQSNVAAIRAEQVARRRDEIAESLPPDPPRLVQAVRPDVAADVARISDDAVARPARAEREYDGPPIQIDFTELEEHTSSAAFVSDGADTGIDTSVLTDGTLSLRQDDIASDGDDPIVDAFDLLDCETPDERTA
jgi:transposase InsO family protein